jgi:hypothetical protein
MTSLPLSSRQLNRVRTSKEAGRYVVRDYMFNPFTASCENAMSLSMPGVSAPCEKFPHSSQLNFE